MLLHVQHLTFLFPMDYMQSESATARWTFADLASTYRFWALIAIWALSVLAFSVFVRSTPPILLLRPRGFIPEILVYGKVAGSLFGTVLGMLVVRAKTIQRMAVLAAIGLAGYLAAWLMLDRLAYFMLDGLMYSICAFLGALVVSAFTMAITLMLANAVADRFALGVALVVLSISQFFYHDLDPSWFIVAFPKESLGGWIFISAIALGGALLLLATVRRGFDDPPVMRHRPLMPAPRSGDKVTSRTRLLWLSVGGGMVISFFAPLQILLMLPVIWYGFWAALAILSVSFIVGLIASTYWIYRIHGEVAYVHPSAKLFTPRAAVLFFLLVPMSAPLLLLSLDSVLRDAWAQRAGSTYQSKSRFNMWCLVFPPIAMGMIQDQLNELMVAHSDRDSVGLSLAASDSSARVA
ncbi:hypothetical protein [Achromobacter spanius]|nr:hypothetical protein [Achromobacter spanius]